ncbi:hypothetical protein ACFYZB_43175 [Streptomyces sp. NPDC001852]|uniref:hypothetical protein n=1 Tax=Streptomyces sp. NPDC001852 TaxID=3364619 RepID=UPI0036801FA9
MKDRSDHREQRLTSGSAERPRASQHLGDTTGPSWTIERTTAWIAGFLRPRRRYERKAGHFMAFTGIAGTRICSP